MIVLFLPTGRKQSEPKWASHPLERSYEMIADRHFEKMHRKVLIDYDNTL